MCLKTLSGKYLAPKLISLFDQKKERRKTERSELKKRKRCKTPALVKTKDTIMPRSRLWKVPLSIFNTMWLRKEICSVFPNIFFISLETLMNHSDTQPPLIIIQRVIQSVRICSIRIQDIRPKAPPSTGDNRNSNMWNSVSLLFSSSWESVLSARGHEGFFKNLKQQISPIQRFLQTHLEIRDLTVFVLFFWRKSPTSSTALILVAVLYYDLTHRCYTP